MKSKEISNQKITEAAVLLEQIQSVNEMIDLHQKESDSFMLNQY